jgi:hypothetical protein
MCLGGAAAGVEEEEGGRGGECWRLDEGLGLKARICLSVVGRTGVVGLDEAPNESMNWDVRVLGKWLLLRPGWGWGWSRCMAWLYLEESKACSATSCRLSLLQTNKSSSLRASRRGRGGKDGKGPENAARSQGL